MAKLTAAPDSPEANALVMELRQKVIDIFHDMGAIHLQIARSYPLKQSHDAAGWDMLKALKAQVDPKGLMNPGSLAL